MRQLVIIGNGFDLAHGLKTSYRDFIIWYLHKIIKKDRPRREFDKSKDLAWLHYQNYNTNKYSDLGDIISYLDKNKGEVEYNKFFKLLISKCEKANWVDIEATYFNKLIDEIRIPLESKQYEIPVSYVNRVKELNSSLDLIKKYLEEYLYEIDGFNFKFIPDIKNHFNEIFELTGGRANTEEEVFILNFNYTSTIKKYFDNDMIDTDDKRYVINYIHGKINSITNPIIFGYGDEMNQFYKRIEDYNINELTKNFKSFYYLQSSNYQNLFDFIEQGEFSVSIMGHSCGLSDRILFNNIFQHENLKEIQIFYHKRGELRDENDFFEKTQNISRYFDSNSKHIMRYKIVPFSKCSPLVGSRY